MRGSEIGFRFSSCRLCVGFFPAAGRSDWKLAGSAWGAAPESKVSFRARLASLARLVPARLELVLARQGQIGASSAWGGRVDTAGVGTFR